MDKLGELILQERKIRDWSQRKLARKSGVSRQTVSNYESGRITNPEPEKLRAIANAFNRPEEIFLRAAGVLSPKRKISPLEKELINLVKKLPEEEQQEMVDMIRWKVERHQSGQSRFSA